MSLYRSMQYDRLLIGALDAFLTQRGARDNDLMLPLPRASVVARGALKASRGTTTMAGRERWSGASRWTTWSPPRCRPHAAFDPLQEIVEAVLEVLLKRWEERLRKTRGRFTPACATSWKRSYAD